MNTVQSYIPHRAAVMVAVAAIFFASGWMFEYGHEAGLPKGVVEIGALQPVVSQ